MTGTGMLASASDETLIRKALRGSERAWLKLVRKYERRLYNYCLRMTSKREDALDLMQEIFLCVYRNLPNYHGDGVFPAWLFRIAGNKVVDFYRKRARDPVNQASEWQDDWQSQHAGRSDEQALGDNRLITRLLECLPPEQRLVVELKFFQQFTFEEIAGQMEISTNTAKSRLYAALGKLREHEDLSHAM